MARIVRASFGAASSRADQHPQPVQGRLHSTGPGRSTAASSATVTLTSGPRALSGQSSTSGRMALGSLGSAAGRGARALPNGTEASVKSEEKAEARAADARVGAMQALCQGLGLSRAKLSDVLVQRLRAVLDVGLCRILFVETGHDSRTPELVQVRTPLMCRV
jgi:hypothetical protein